MPAQTVGSSEIVVIVFKHPLAGIHDLHVWSLISGVNAVSLQAVLWKGADYGTVLSEIHQVVTTGFNIQHVTVQLEANGWIEKETYL